MKKLLSVLIAMIMIVGVLPVTAFSASKTVNIYGCRISASAKQVCFVVGDENDFSTTFTAENYAPGFKKYYYVPRGTVIDCKVIAEKLPELQNLAIVYGGVKNLSALAELKDLVWLGLYQNDGAENLSFLKKLPRLKKFGYAMYNKCESINPVSYLKDLTELYIKVPSDAVSDTTPLKGLTKLKKLDINVKKDADLSFLKKLTKLESLKIRGVRSVKGLESVKGLKKLKSLDIDGLDSEQQDLSFIGEMTWLESLYVSDSNRSFSKNISDLKSLKSLSILYTDIGVWYDRSFLKDLTGLEYLYLVDVQELDLTVISNLTKLKDLSVMLCEVGDLSGLKKCSALENLAIFNCSTDFDVKWITGTDVKKLYF